MVYTSQRWKQIEILFNESIALPEALRTDYLNEHCGDDLELRREVEELLFSSASDMTFLEQPVIEAAQDLASPAVPHTLLPGDPVDRYEIISFIGSGGMGHVYLARDTRLQRKVAIKILAPALARDQHGLRRLEKEAHAASALNHPNIVTIYEFGQSGALHFIATEYVEGPTLREKLDAGRLELGAATDIAAQIARALEAAHSAGIVHRDIKPENVLVRTDQLVKVVDFGIAKLSDSQSQQGICPPALALSISMSHPGMVVGSAKYMSPEQARGQNVDARSDIFSLGVVLYEMVGGQCPFHGETVSDTIAEILKATPKSLREILPGAPPELEQIVSRAMAKDREARYQSAREMLADLTAFANRLQFQASFPEASAPKSAKLAPARSVAPVTGPGAAGFRIRSRAGRLVVSALLLAVAACGVILAVRERRGGTNPAPPRSHTLAILPFHNLRQDPSLDYLGFSLADAIITELSSVNGLTVRPSSSVYAYRNQSVNPQKAGQDLNVDTLLTGGFIRDGDDLRITAQLIDLKQNRILWRDSVDAKFDDLLSVQDRVSQEIAKGLELDLSPALNSNSDKPANPQAYEDYLRGIDLSSMNDFPAAIAILEKSVALNPDYAPAWAQLGKTYAASATLRLGGREQYDKAQSAYEKAIALNPNLVEPRVYMANMLTDTGRVEQAVPLLRAALQISPSDAEVHWELGYAYRFAGMLKESVAESEQARQIEPQVKINSSAINAYLYLGEYARFLDSLPNLDSAYILFYRGLAEYYQHRQEQAVQDFDRAYLLDPDLVQAKIGETFRDAIQGRRDAALALLHRTQDEMEDRGVGDAESMYKIAEAYAVLGDKPAALHALSHTVEGGFFCDSCFSGDPLLAGIRADPEFQRLTTDAHQRHDQFKAQFF
jgi:TolB-like protein/tRNA A-37 threonylcarbamoyl transferase component Bud32/Flp pilus assembly protein TadD